MYFPSVLVLANGMAQDFSVHHRYSSWKLCFMEGHYSIKGFIRMLNLDIGPHSSFPDKKLQRWPRASLVCYQKINHHILHLLHKIQDTSPDRP